MKKRDSLIIVVAAGLISFLYYGPFLDNYFVWDDFMMLENFTSGSLRQSLLGFGDLRIVGNLILWFNFFISELNPVGYSLISIGAHIVNSVMLLLLIHSLSNNRLLSMFTAVIFAASAVGADAIFWRCAFLTVTGLFFYLFILYLYVEGRKRRSRAYRNLALIAFTLAIFNKEEIASIPFMIIFIEMIFFKDGSRLYLRLKRVLPYFLVIVIYILLSSVISRYYVSQEQFERFLSFRLPHTLVSGFASFFISPDGKLNWNDPFLYSTTLLVALYFVLIKDRKFLLLGLGWVFLTFLPQSMTALTRYDVPYLFNSISRHLYLPSVGPAIVFSVILLAINERFPRKIFAVTIALFFTGFILFNYERVNGRGKQWQDVGMSMKWFLYSLKELQPSFPKNSYVSVLNGPGGRAYVMRALRGFYKNPKIYWIDEPNKNAYIYLYLNGYLVNEHKSLLRLAYYVKNEDIRYVTRFYDLKELHKEKLEILRAISGASFNDAEKHFILALAYRDMEKWDDAIAEFKAALAIKPNDINTHYSLGMVYMAKGESNLAIKEFELAKAKEFVEYVKKMKGVVANEK